MTTLATNNELTLNTLRRLALMQHLGEDFFIYDGKAYEGLLAEIERKLCKATSFKAWYLSTNKELFPQSKNQL